MKIFFTNELNTDVFDFSFYQVLFNRLVMLQEQKERDVLSQSKSVF